MTGFISNNKAGVQRSNVRYTNNPEKQIAMARASLATQYSNNLHEAGFDEILTPEEMQQVIDTLTMQEVPPQSAEDLTGLVKDVLEWRKDNFVERNELWIEDDSNDRQDEWYLVDNNDNPIDADGNPLQTDEQLMAEYNRTQIEPSFFNNEGYRVD